MPIYEPHDRVDASCLSEQDGERLLVLRQWFRQRSDGARAAYLEALAKKRSLNELVWLRATSVSWQAAHTELEVSFNWTTVPGSTTARDAGEPS